MATIAEHIFLAYNGLGSILTTEEIIAYASTAESIILSWDTDWETKEYVVFVYDRSSQLLYPSESPSKQHLLAIDGPVKPRAYSASEFKDLSEKAVHVRFKYVTHINSPSPHPSMKFRTNYKVNYPHIITELAKLGIVETMSSTNVMAVDGRKFRLLNSYDDSIYEVDCLGTTLFRDMSEYVQRLYIQSFTRVST